MCSPASRRTSGLFFADFLPLERSKLVTYKSEEYVLRQDKSDNMNVEYGKTELKKQLAHFMVLLESR